MTYPGPPQPPGAYPRPRKRRRWPLIAGSIVAILVVIGALALAFNGREGSSDPHTAVDKFWAAIAQHDSSKAEKYMCKGKDLKNDNDTVKAVVNDITGYEIGPHTGSGNSRVYAVTVRLAADGQVQNHIFDTTAKKSGRKWYVCNFADHP